ncbi:solute carrier family 45 member 3-like isoform X2 [Salvelinus alpinus]|uniref:solute carrier family 45 member 3-like isoform X2 n=1 Tax=Salvelinus alpinus TaxID=8036 RepID=UPI0039FBF44F
MQGRVCQLLLVNALTCGLEVCMAAGTFYIPPLLLQAGIEERYMTMVLGVGPILGLIFVPVIGSYSDSWRGRFGRRRPFIWLLCVGVLLGLQVLPQASHLAALLYPQSPRWLEGVLLVGAACLLEFSGQACFTPLEALISDQFPGEEESRRAFSVYSLMISLGGCLGYLLPALDWSHAPTAAYLGGQEAFIYVLITLIFLTCLVSTVFISEDRWTGGERTRKGVSTLWEWDCTVEYPTLHLEHRRDYDTTKVFFSSARPSHQGESDDHTHSKPLLPPDNASPNVSLPLEREGEAVPLPQRGMCLDMAILDSAYLLSQVLPALCLGSIVQQSHSVSAYMASACFLSLLSLLCSTGVVFTRSDLHRLTGSKGDTPTLRGLKD